jgi:anti-anti-sigma factor
MTSFAVSTRTETDGSLVVTPSGPLDGECAVRLRQVLIHAVRKIRPPRLVVDLAAVTAVDPINVGTLAALCDLADDHRVVVFLDNVPRALASRLQTAGIPAQRLRMLVR